MTSLRLRMHTYSQHPCVAEGTLVVLCKNQPAALPQDTRRIAAVAARSTSFRENLPGFRKWESSSSGNVKIMI